jgi:hypothetical protein
MMPALPQNLGPWLFVFWAVLFLCFWSLVVALISIVGGWRYLAKSYPAEETTFRIAGGNVGKRFRWTSLVLGPRFFPTNYGNCVNVVVNDLGIRIAVMPLFRTLHPPILIPWSAIERSTLDRQFQFFTRATVEVTGSAHPLRFYGNCAREIDRVWAGRETSVNVEAARRNYVNFKRE